MKTNKIFISIISGLIVTIAPPAVLACESKYSSSAYGSLSTKKWTRIQEESINKTMNLSGKKLSLSQIQSILGFDGELIKTRQGKRVEHWIWLDRKNCRRHVKAIFSDNKLVSIKKVSF